MYAVVVSCPRNLEADGEWRVGGRASFCVDYVLES